MNLTLIGNVNELTSDEQKTLYTAGADIYTGGLYYLVADPENFTQVGKDVVPNVPALRAMSSTSSINWVFASFRGKKVAFGSAVN